MLVQIYMYTLSTLTLHSLIVVTNKGDIRVCHVLIRNKEKVEILV
jgi:hypothetical protein